MVANGYIIQLSIVAAAAAAEKLLVHRAAGCSVFFSSHPWLLGRGMKKKKKPQISQSIIWKEKRNRERIPLLRKAVLHQTLGYNCGSSGDSSLFLPIKVPDVLTPLTP